MQDAAAVRSSTSDTAPAVEAGMRSRDRGVAVMLTAAVLEALRLRLKHYLAQQPHWHDEASLVVNIFEKSARELLGPLESAQAAAPGFLLLERGMHVRFGRSELAMRLPSLLASLAGLALFAVLTW